MQYYWRYIEGIKEPPGVALLMGQATHRSIQRNLEQKIETGVLLPLEEAQEIARDELNKRWSREEVKLSDAEVEEGIKNVKGRAVDASVRLSTLHHAEIAPMLNPSHVERRFTLELDGYPVDLQGVIDVEDQDGDSIIVRDTKTTGKSPNPTDADTSEQLTFYSLGVEVEEGRKPDKVTLDTLVNTQTPKKVILESTRDDADHEVLLRRIERAIEVIEKEAFIPANPSSYSDLSRVGSKMASSRPGGFVTTNSRRLFPVSLSTAENPSER